MKLLRSILHQLTTRLPLPVNAAVIIDVRDPAIPLIARVRIYLPHVGDETIDADLVAFLELGARHHIRFGLQYNNAHVLFRSSQQTLSLFT